MAGACGARWLRLGRDGVSGRSGQAGGQGVSVCSSWLLLLPLPPSLSLPRSSLALSVFCVLSSSFLHVSLSLSSSHSLPPSLLSSPLFTPFPPLYAQPPLLHPLRSTVALSCSPLSYSATYADPDALPSSSTSSRIRENTFYSKDREMCWWPHPQDGSIPSPRAVRLSFVFLLTFRSTD